MLDKTCRDIYGEYLPVCLNNDVVVSIIFNYVMTIPAAGDWVGVFSGNRSPNDGDHPWNLRLVVDRPIIEKNLIICDISGWGRDQFGRFRISGSVDINVGSLQFVKKYGSYGINYKGGLDTQQHMSGTWDMTRGSFTDNGTFVLALVDIAAMTNTTKALEVLIDKGDRKEGTAGTAGTAELTMVPGVVHVT